MIKAFLLRVIRQAIEEFLTPQLQALRADIGAKFSAALAELKAEFDARFAALNERLEERFTALNERLEEIERRLATLEEEAKAHGVQLARLDQRVIDLKETLDVERRLSRIEAQIGLIRE